MKHSKLLIGGMLLIGGLFLFVAETKDVDSICPRQCLLPGSKILIEDNKSVNIEDIKVGDKIIGFDEKTSQTKLVKVAKVFKHKNKGGYYRIFLENGWQLEVTGNHPVYIASDICKRADNLKVDYTILTKCGLIKIVKIEFIPKPSVVYNLEVSNTHNYFANGILVHNKTPDIPRKPDDPPIPREPDDPPIPRKPDDPPIPKDPSKPPNITPPPNTTPIAPAPEQPAAPTQPIQQPPSSGSTTSPYTSPAQPRPSLGLGLQPFIQSLQASAASSLLGVVEPWEVWWTRNRDKYLSFREDIQWVKIVNNSGSQSIKVYPIYPELIKVLSDALADKNPYIAFRAAIALGKAIDVKNSVSVNVIETLKKANETETRYFVRNNILLGSSLSGDNSFVALMKQVAQDKTTPSLRRSYAILAMGNITDDPELPKIMKSILSDQDNTEVKSCACLSLGNLKDASAVPILGKLLNGSNGRKEHSVVRAYAALGLGRIGTKEALNELKKSTPASERDTNVLSAVVIALGLTGSPDAKDSILPFLTYKKDAILRGLATISLAQTKDAKSYDLISEAFRQNKSNDADALMLLALGLTGDERAKTDLRKILEDKKTRILLKAASAIGLGLLKDSESVPIIGNMLNDDKQLNNVVIAPYLIISLGMISAEGGPTGQDSTKGVEVLQKIWDKIETNRFLYPYHTNVAVALTMLGKKKDVILPKLVRQANQTKNPLLRSYALHTLGLLGDRESAKAFVDAYKDNDTFVRCEAIDAIGFLLDKNKMNPLNKITADNIDISTLIMDHILPIPVW
ncbi:MAG: HEAT repeat domain-containing protein [Planctomycetota bacterium]